MAGIGLKHKMVLSCSVNRSSQQRAYCWYNSCVGTQQDMLTFKISNFRRSRVLLPIIRHRIWCSQFKAGWTVGGVTPYIGCLGQCCLWCLVALWLVIVQKWLAAHPVMLLNDKVGQKLKGSLPDVLPCNPGESDGSSASLCSWTGTTQSSFEMHQMSEQHNTPTN